MVQRPLPIEAIGELAGELKQIRAVAATMSAAGPTVQYRYACYLPSDRMCLSVVDAPDAATVLELLRRAGLTTARVLEAVLFAGDDPRTPHQTDQPATDPLPVEDDPMRTNPLAASRGRA